jgi:hypothetical protein
MHTNDDRSCGYENIFLEKFEDDVLAIRYMLNEMRNLSSRLIWNVLIDIRMTSVECSGARLH